MTSGTSMMVIGVYLMLFGSMAEAQILHWAGLILAMIGFFVTGHFEDEYKYRLERLEKLDWLEKKENQNGT